MNLVVTYSSKEGLLREYLKRYPEKENDSILAPDLFAEGDSIDTINAVINALHKSGHKATGLEADFSLSGQLESLRPQLVFNMAEGLWGDFRESYVPFVCERLGIPYTGSDPLTLGICLNKARTKEYLSFHGIATAPFQIFYPGMELVFDGVGFPAIVKPVAEGSSKGIYNDSVVHEYETARTKINDLLINYEQPVLLEKYLPGKEFTVAMWGNGSQAEVLPIVAMNYNMLPSGANPIYSYEAKWIWDTVENPVEIFECPALIDDNLTRKIENLALSCYHALHIRDWCRIDIRLDGENNPFVLELNPIPGILPDPRENSCFPKAARTAGHNYEEMLANIVSIAAKRYKLDLS